MTGRDRSRRPGERLGLVWTLAFGVLLTAALLLAAAVEADRQELLHLDTFRGDLFDQARISETIIVDQLRGFDDSLLVLRGANSVDPQLVAERLRLLRGGPLADREVMFVLFDRTGRIAYTDVPNVKPGLYRGDQPYFRYFSEGGPDRFYVAEPAFGRVTQRYSLPLARPVFDGQGSFLGVVALSVRQDALSSFGPRLSPAGDTEVTIVTKSGAVVSRSRDLAKIQGTTFSAEEMAPLLGAGEGVFSHSASADGVERFVAHRHLEGLPLIVIVSASPGAVLHQVAVLRAGLLSGAAFLSLTILALILVNFKRRKLAARYRETQRGHLQAAQRIAGVGSWELDLEKGSFIWSDEVYALLGVSPDGFKPDLEHFLALVPEAERATVQTAFAPAPHAGAFSLEHAIRRGDGQARDMVLRGEVLRAKDGKATTMIGTVQDVTERKRAEELPRVQIRLSEYAHSHTLDELLTRTLDEAEILTGSSIGFFHFLDADQRTLWLQAWSTNTLEKMCTAAGKGKHYPVDQAGVWVDCIHSRAPVIHNDYSALAHRKGLPAGHAPVARELVVPIIRDGAIVAILGLGNKSQEYAGQDVDIATRLASQVWDIVVAKRAQDELLSRTALLDAIFQSAPFVMVLLDAAGRILDINRAGGDGAGGKKAELLGLMAGQALDCVNALGEPGCGRTPACRSCPIRARFTHTSLTGEPVHDEQARFTVLRDGERVNVDFLISTAPVTVEGARNVLLTLVDITERARAEEAVRVSESRLREAQLIGKMGNWELDAASGSLWWSDEVYELFGLQSHCGISFERFLGIIHPEDRDRVESAVRAATEQRLTAWQFDYRIVRGGAEVRFMHESATADLDCDGRVIRRRGIVQDVTERMTLEAQLRQAQKMEAIGTLAGGVAHDFNNILNVIKGYGFLLERGAAPGGPLAGYVREVLTAIERGVDLTGALLAFSRRQETVTAVIGLNAVVRGMQGMIARILGEEVRLELALAPEDPLVEGDAGQFGQVVMNLATNARDAMPRGGSLAIRTETLVLSSHLFLSDFAVAAGAYAVLRVRDCGHGMADEVRRRIFEPFFTTKESGRGTGLGLAVAFGIVKQHHGFIECTSALGAGTAFTVYLPLFQGPARTETPHAANEASLPDGKEHLLIAEDDEAGRRMLTLVLREHGYAVTAACDGVEAIRLLAAAPAAFDLLLLDLVMPNSNGLEVLEHARRLRPGIPAILMSGYSDEVIRERGLPLASIPILRKPVDIEALGALIRATLDEATSGAG